MGCKETRFHTSTLNIYIPVQITFPQPKPNGSIHIQILRLQTPSKNTSRTKSNSCANSHVIVTWYCIISNRIRLVLLTNLYQQFAKVITLDFTYPPIDASLDNLSQNNEQ
eukprot:70677_1